MRNRRYETVFILPADSDEGKKKEILDRLDGVVEKGGGIRVKREDWGVRRMAYQIKNHQKGHYLLLDFVGTAQIVAELERHMRMLEDVYRFLTVKTDDRVDLEAAKQEQAEERDKEAARAAAAKEAAEKEAAAKAAAEQEAAEKEAAEREAAAAEPSPEEEEAESPAEPAETPEAESPEADESPEAESPEAEEKPEVETPEAEPQEQAEAEEQAEKKVEG